jgi:dGTPase
MQWEKLLSDERQGNEKHREDPHERNQFERDIDRIIFSEAFRRLKDKTQVFPITDHDHVHNRLAHSLEVSCVGRSLGRLAGAHILREYENDLKELKEEKGLNEASFGAIVQAACLAHDIGNPPFGHSGENAIQSWFYTETGRQQLDQLNASEKEDLELFEGNAQGFRILTRSERQFNRNSLQLTFATLATFAKYPRESLVYRSILEENSWRVSAKKYGFFQSEKEVFEKVAEKTGLNQITGNAAWWCRHPLAFLVEAADDICYLIMDLEDGFNTGYIDYKTTKELLLSLADDEVKNEEREILKEESALPEKKENIRFLRGKAINKLITLTKDSFIRNEKRILTGEFDTPLLDSGSDEIKQRIKAIKSEVKDKVYRCQEVLLIEIAGYDAISALMSEFIISVNDGVVSGNSKKRNKKSEKLNEILPGKIVPNGYTGNEKYLNILRVTDFIAGMTDSYAVSLFREIKGISLSRYR